MCVARLRWMVFPDSNNRDTRDNNEEIIRVHGALSGDGALTGNTNVANRISFNPQGMADASIGTLTYSDSRGADYAANLIISFGGSVRLEDSY